MHKEAFNGVHFIIQYFRQLLRFFVRMQNFQNRLEYAYKR